MQFKIQLMGEQLKLDMWSVFLGSLASGVLVLFAGNPLWLSITGFIFGSMSRRGVVDGAMNGLASAIAITVLLSIYGSAGIPGIQSVLYAFQIRGLAYTSTALFIVILSFLLSATGAFAGSAIFRYYISRRGRMRNR
ncbi:MAG: hypothetical protein J9259_03330 [Thermoplasmata archaeon YP2-bin.285]|nr:hypothetical protein [Candidatus Sysuiplasma superficiale]